MKRTEEDLKISTDTSSSGEKAPVRLTGGKKAAAEIHSKEESKKKEGGEVTYQQRVNTLGVAEEREQESGQRISVRSDAGLELRLCAGQWGGAHQLLSATGTNH